MILKKNRIFRKNLNFKNFKIIKLNYKIKQYTRFFIKDNNNLYYILFTVYWNILKKKNYFFLIFMYK
jgi:hypothetical protein